MFLVLTQHNPILEIPQTELQATYPYVKARISREPTQQELQQAYLNYRILRDLDKK
jgi:hypothetical protein